MAISCHVGRDSISIPFQAKARGVTILISQNALFEAHNVVADEYVRSVMMSGKLYNTLITLVNVYGPNKDDKNFLLSS